jgi:hypothetical protein
MLAHGLGMFDSVALAYIIGIQASLGEHDRRSVVWDYVAVYPPGSVWEASPPEPLYSGGPVIRVMDEARSALSKAFNADQARHVGAK